MDPLLLEKRIASWKDSSEDESGNCIEEEEPQRIAIDVDKNDFLLVTVRFITVDFFQHVLLIFNCVKSVWISLYMFLTHS
jgi:hypothetical protein